MAARYWVGGGSSANWNATGNTNWSATSGGANNASVPTSSDTVTFDGAGINGNTNSIISATITVSDITITAGYTATMTHNATLSCNSNLTLNTGYTIAGTAAINLTSTSTITSNGKVWPNSMTFSSSNPKTLVGNFQITGTLTISNAMAVNLTTSETLTIGGLTANANMSGTALVILTSGTWNGVGNISSSLNLQGTITIGTVANYGTGTLTYVSGTITCTGTLTLVASCTLNTDTVQWANISLASVTITINSTLRTTTLTLTGSPVFAGTDGWICSTLSHAGVSAFTITLKESITYTVTSSLQAFQARTGSIILFTSAHASTKANLTLQNGATCQCLCSFTRIDASGGRPIRTFNGTVTDCNNIVSFFDLKSVGSAL